MTTQEAIQTIKQHNEAHSKRERFAIHITEALKMAIKALEKQTPKKPTHEATLYRCLTCPSCKNVIDEFIEFIPDQPKIRVTTPHCKFCGQALDWGDTE